MVLFVSPEQETVVHYIDNHMAVLYEPDSREIVGFQVEAFESAFIKMHNNVQSAWTIDVGSVTLNLAIDTVRKQQKLFVQELGNVARPKLQQRGLVYA